MDEQGLREYLISKGIQVTEDSFTVLRNRAASLIRREVVPEYDTCSSEEDRDVNPLFQSAPVDIISQLREQTADLLDPKEIFEHFRESARKLVELPECWDDDVKPNVSGFVISNNNNGEGITCASLSMGTVTTMTTSQPRVATRSEDYIPNLYHTNFSTTTATTTTSSNNLFRYATVGTTMTGFAPYTRPPTCTQGNQSQMELRIRAMNQDLINEARNTLITRNLHEAERPQFSEPKNGRITRLR